MLEMQKEAAEMDYGDCYDDSGNLLAIKDMPLHVRRNLAEMTVTTNDQNEVFTVNKIKMTDRAKAREILMKYNGMLVEKHQHSGSINTGVTHIESEYVSPDVDD